MKYYYANFTESIVTQIHQYQQNIIFFSTSTEIYSLIHQFR